MRILKYGKDQVNEPCVELDDGTLLTQTELLTNLVKALQTKDVVVDADVKVSAVSVVVDVKS